MTIQWEVTVEEANLILQALGQMPYVSVMALVPRLRASAERQVNHAKPEPPPTE